MAYETLHVDREGRIIDELPCSACGHSLRGQSAGAACPGCGETIALSTLGRAVCRVDERGLLDESLRCSTCGYDLRGIDPAGACPECHVPVGQSLEGNLLRYGDPRWTKKVADGLVLYVIALALAISLGVGAAALRFAIKDAAVIALVTVTTTVVSGVFTALALWWITAPDPDTPIPAQQRFGANLARLLVIPQVLATAGLGAFTAFTNPQQGQALAMLLQLPVMVLGALVGVGLLLHLRELARRVVDETLANWARTILWLTVIGTLAAMLGLGVMASTSLATGQPMPAPGQTPSGPMLIGLGAGAIGGCIGGLLNIIAMIWTIVLLFKLRAYFTAAARAASARDAIATSRQ
ncbi:MAG: hypothetical protein IT430_03520 [Phycisphaerales bacterium]|nr:hypothetical protein [Phycisphaerales bacterium]